ncbi:MAG: peptidoglycan DD-metalloendopeptidase family protein [Alphaproteobacteria bacterium]
MAFGALALVVTVGTPPELHAERARGAEGAVVLAALSPKPAPALRRPTSNGNGVEIAPAERRRIVKARRGDTFMKMMLSAGAARAEAHRAIVAMRRVFNPRDLDVGQALTAIFQKDRLAGFSFRPSVDYTVRVSRDGDAFQAEKITHALTRRDVRVSAIINSNLYAAAGKAGMPASVLTKLVRLLSWDVDFQRDIQKGDRFDALVERFDLEDGGTARWGDILYAELVLSGTPIRLYRHETKRGGVEYFDEKGRSAQKALMRTPINGARLSSGYGRRRHPILGYNKMHRGLDFAAPRGTPIYAAGSGRVRYAGRKGAYGRYIRIRHNGRYATAYAHLKRFARGVRRGKRVRQGQIIGYVGTSGRSTGPHLHYEILVNGRQVNPARLRLPSGRRLKGRELKVFHAERARLDQRRAALPTTLTVTSR